MNTQRRKQMISLLLTVTLCFSMLIPAFGQSSDIHLTLTSPASQQAFNPGDEVVITGTVQNVSQVTVSVRNSRGGLVYTAQPAVTNGEFTTRFTLASDAIEGDYTINIGGLGEVEPCVHHFQVMALTSPALQQKFEPGDEVVIAGTVNDVSQVTVSVRNSRGGLVYTAQPAVTNGEFTTRFTLAADAVEGDYTINIGGLGSAILYTSYFKVQKDSAGPGPGPGPQPDIVLTVKGAVQSTGNFTMDDLEEMGEITDTYYALNNFGTEKEYECRGISLIDLLEDQVDLKSNARSVNISGDDGYNKSFNINDLKGDYRDDTEPMLAWESRYRVYSQDGDKWMPWRSWKDHGLKLVIGQRENQEDETNNQYFVQGVDQITVYTQSVEYGAGSPPNYTGPSSKDQTTTPEQKVNQGQEKVNETLKEAKKAAEDISSGNLTSKQATKKAKEIMEESLKTTVQDEKVSGEQAANAVNQVVKDVVGALVNREDVTVTQAKEVVKSVIKDTISDVVSKDKEAAKTVSNTMAAMVNKVVEKAGIVAQGSIQAQTDTANPQQAMVAVDDTAIMAKINAVEAVAKEMMGDLNANNLPQAAAQVEKSLVIEVPQEVINKEEIKVALSHEAIEALREKGMRIMVKSGDVEITITADDLVVSDRTANIQSGNVLPGETKKKVEICTNKLQAADAQWMLDQVEGYLNPLGGVYELTANMVTYDENDQSIGSQAINHFKEKVNVTLAYNPARVENEDKLGAYWHNPQTGAWELMGARVDKAAHTVAFKTDHFSQFALMENQNHFTDMANHWAKNDVEIMLSKGIVKGLTDVQFAPEASITRAQFAALLFRALEMDQVNGSSISFKDVSDAAWYKDVVAAAADAGLIKGYDANTFGPDDLITREQMAVMIARAAKMKLVAVEPDEEVIADELSGFNDKNKIDDWAKPEATLAIRKGIVNGMTKDQFAPKQNATRAQGAVMILRLYNLLQQ